MLGWMCLYARARVIKLLFDFFASQHGKRNVDGEGTSYFQPYGTPLNQRTLTTTLLLLPHPFFTLSHTGGLFKNWLDSHFSKHNITIIDLEKIVELLTANLSKPKDDPNKIHSPTERHFRHQPGVHNPPCTFETPFEFVCQHTPSTPPPLFFFFSWSSGLWTQVFCFRPTANSFFLLFCCQWNSSKKRTHVQTSWVQLRRMH